MKSKLKTFGNLKVEDFYPKSLNRKLLPTFRMCQNYFKRLKTDCDEAYFESIKTYFVLLVEKLSK